MTVTVNLVMDLETPDLSKRYSFTTLKKTRSYSVIPVVECKTLKDSIYVLMELNQRNFKDMVLDKLFKLYLKPHLVGLESTTFVYVMKREGDSRKYLGYHKGKLDAAGFFKSRSLLNQFHARPKDFRIIILESGNYREILDLYKRLKGQTDTDGQPLFQTFQHVPL